MTITETKVRVAVGALHRAWCNGINETEINTQFSEDDLLINVDALETSHPEEFHRLYTYAEKLVLFGAL